MLHVWDMFVGDALYICTSDMVSIWILVFLVLSYFLPLIYLLFISFINPRKDKTGKSLLLNRN